MQQQLVDDVIHKIGKLYALWFQTKRFALLIGIV